MANIHSNDYYDFLEEQESKEYLQSVKYWKEHGKKGSPPETPEERMLRKHYIAKYGEY